jgi:hypothetical protein
VPLGPLAVNRGVVNADECCAVSVRLALIIAAVDSTIACGEFWEGTMSHCLFLLGQVWKNGSFRDHLTKGGRLLMLPVLLPESLALVPGIGIGQSNQSNEVSLRRAKCRIIGSRGARFCA